MSQSGVKVAALQMVSGPSIEENLTVAARLIAQAASSGAQLLVLPESFALFGSQQQYALGLREAEIIQADQNQAGSAPLVRRFLAEQAERHRLWLVAGTLPLATADDDRVFAASLLFNELGEEVGCYHKIHLFDANVADDQGAYQESRTYKPGSQPQVWDTPFGRLGIAVCYDIRFPEMFRLMLKQGVDIIAVPAAFTRHTGQAHWLPLLRARAIENQCFVVGANQGGDHGQGRFTSGGSVIIDAWGRVLAEAAFGESTITAELDFSQLSQLRRDMPVIDHIRF